MDREEARFILRCFRPDGADAENPDFAEALAWAAKDRELGAWLAHERSSDAEFAKALNSVGIPVELRDEILTGLAVERGDDGGRPDEFDRRVMGALASVKPPPGLRGDILAAMVRTVAPPEPAKSRWSGWWLGLPLAAAAGIAVAFVVSAPESGRDTKIVSLPPADGGGVVQASLTLEGIENGFIEVFESPDFTLDLENSDHQELFNYLRSEKLPCPSHCIPKGIKELPGVGCRELKIRGKKGTLICFKREGSLVHVVVFKREDVKCKLPESGKPVTGEHGNWGVSRWEDQDCVFVMLEKKH
ncbi:hypothetical protein [Luteolibacter marinus]|uniref:hypothetical protein n=1 Tax=Luteolibacter marinus TaxID=2776705 RepID=UPI001867462A|nr:hypothetical protein [Luteolibacter marinus]